MQPVLILCIVVATVQIVYLAVFLKGFSSKAPLPTLDQPVPVSVIVCAHDEERNLRELVPILLQQDHPEFEVIIVEDRSNDASFDFLHGATQEDPRLRMVRVVQSPAHINGKKFALTLGIKSAKFENILLTDADCRPLSKSWITEMSKHFEKEKEIVIGFSPYSKSDGFLNLFIRFESFLTGIQYIAFALAGAPYMGVGRNLAYKKSLFLDNKGFNDHLGVTGGDDDLFINQHASQKNVAVALGPATLVHSIPKTSWKDFYYQKLRHLSVGKRYKAAHRFALGLFSLTWILTWLTLLIAVPAFFQQPVDVTLTILLAVFLLRWILLYRLFSLAQRRMGEPFEAGKVPFLDFIYAFYYLVVGLMALFSKKVRWKN